MIKVFITSFLFFFMTSSLMAQKTHEYMGFLKIQDSLFISYRLKFEVNDGEIKGFSVTDYGGAHETKSYVTGSYNQKGRVLSFREYGIEYTKSEVEAYDFCYVNFEGKLKNIDRQSMLEGTFNGKYDDGEKCIDGELLVRTIDKMYRKAERLDKKIKRMKRLPDSTKAKINLVKMLDEKRLNVLKKDENTTVFWDSDTIELVLWDAGKEDGDIVSLTFNGEKQLRNYTIGRNKKVIPLALNVGKNTLSVRAENMGSIHPNTAKIELRANGRTVNLLTNLNSSEATTITLIKR